MVTLLSGLVGGFLATIVMTAAMMVLGDDSPPPTALLWSRYVGDEEPEAYMMQGMVLHFLYGTVAGGVFVVLLPVVGVSVATITSALLWGLVWGGVLFVVAAAFWMNLVLDMDPDPQMAGVFLGFHLLYGATLGLWIGFGILG